MVVVAVVMDSTVCRSTGSGRGSRSVGGGSERRRFLQRPGSREALGLYAEHCAPQTATAAPSDADEDPAAEMFGTREQQKPAASFLQHA